jgi:hypothetical protein
MVCPKFESCPIFIKNVLINPGSAESYKNIYCKSGEHKWKTCKRYIVTDIIGEAIPENIMPNSLKSPEQIIEELKNDPTY